MRAIDIHTHAFPDKIAERAMEKLLAAASWQAFGDGTVGGLIKSMDQAGIDASAVCAIATKGDQAEGIFKWCLEIRSKRIIPFPSVHPATADVAGWIKKIAAAGFAGIKLHPMYQDFAADDPAASAIYSAAADCGLAVAIHCGRDIAFPPDDDRASLKRIRNVLQRHVGLKLICTHMGGWQCWDEVSEYLAGSSAYLETSFSLQFIDAAHAVAIVRKHGADKVLFGSDWPWNRQDEQLELINRLDLSEAEKQAILYSNAKRLLKL